MEVCNDLTTQCLTGNKHDVLWTFNETLTKYECSSDLLTDCCPYYDGAQIYCDPGTDCIVDCNSNNYLCSNVLIQGKDANSLTVLCGSSYNCSDSIISCPDNECNVNCSESGSCDNTKIIYRGNIDDVGVLNVYFYGNSAGDYTEITANNAYKINILCDSLSSNYSCRNTKLFAKYANMVNINVSNLYAAYDAIWYVDHAVSVSFIAKGPCMESVIYINI